MAIFEVVTTVNHRSLMNKSKADLASWVMHLLDCRDESERFRVQRVTDLLEANNFYQQQGRDARTDLKKRFDLVAHLSRQRDFSARTFGPGARTKGVLDHIRRRPTSQNGSTSSSLPATALCAPAMRRNPSSRRGSPSRSATKSANGPTGAPPIRTRPSSMCGSRPMSDFAETRQWWPNDLVDEVMPPGRATPQAWLSPDASGVTTIHADNDDDKTALASIQPGSEVEFLWYENRGSAEILLMPDGTWSLADPRDGGTVDMFAG